MKKIILISLLFISATCFAQSNSTANVTYSGGGINISNMSSKPKETKGSVYFNENWRMGKITLNSGEVIETYPIKYDLKTQRLEIKNDIDIKILDIELVKKLEWLNEFSQKEIYVNCSEFKDLLTEKEAQGFYEVIAKGKITLLKKTNLILQPSNYNEALNVGCKEDTYIKEDKYYVKSDNKIEKINPKRKSVLKLFVDKAEQVDLFAKENNLEFKDENQLGKIFEYYNSL